MITKNQKQILSGITKLSPKSGDVLIFFIKTDDNGNPLIDVDTVHQTAYMISEVLEESGAKGIFLMDKISLFSTQNSEQVIERLENCISAISEANEKLSSDKNGIFTREVVDLEKAYGVVKKGGN